MRFNVRQAKAFLWILNLTAVLLVAYTFYDIYTQKKAGLLGPTPIDEWEKRLRSERESTPNDGANKRAQLKDFNAVWSYDVTGKETSVAAAAAADKQAAAPPPSAVKPIEEVLEVKAIFAPSRAVVNYKADTTTLESLGQKIVSVGSALKTPYDVEPYNAKVLSITADAVEFQWGKEKSQVKIKRNQPGQRPAALAPGAADSQQKDILNRFQEPPEETTQAAPNHYVLSSEDQQNFSSNYEALLAAEARIQQISGKDRKQQIKLELKKTDGRLAQFGFESGDVLISINGQPVSTKAQAINYVRSNTNQSAYTVVIDRRGTRITKTFYAPKKK